MKPYIMKVLFFSIALNFLIVSCYSQADLTLLGQHIKEWQKQLHVPDVGLGVIEDGKIREAVVYGTLPDGKPAPEDMLFNVASVTKVVFTTLVLNLVQEGNWNLDEPLYHYYTDPDVAQDPNAKKITTRHVLSQQSGFVNWRWNHPTGKLTFDFEPGTKFNYSGEGMEYLRKAIENKFHASLSHLADSILFGPFHMTDTRFSWDGKKNFERFSRYYNAGGEEYKKTDYSWSDNAADGLTTTVHDLSTFGIEVMNGAHLSPALFQEMIKTETNVSPNLQQGLGWRVVNGLAGQEYALQHGGNDEGVATLIVLLPKSKRGLIILTNGDNGIVICNNIVREVFPEGAEIIYKSYKATDMKDAPKAVNVDPAILRSYVGNYTQPSGKVLMISQTPKGLLLNMSGVPTLDLYPESPDTFFLLDFDPTIQFTRDGQGKVNAALLIDGGNTIKCVRNADK
jgi:CubicO group peptidase (beta-lactamase class C family)